jgi:hypothetical protein
MRVLIYFYHKKKYLMEKEPVGTSPATYKAAKKEALKAIDAIPKDKRKKVAGIIVFVASLVFLVMAARKLRTNQAAI